MILVKLSSSFSSENSKMNGSTDHEIASHINFKSLRIVLLLLKYIYIYNVHLHVKIILSCSTAKKQWHRSRCKMQHSKTTTFSVCHPCVLWLDPTNFEKSQFQVTQIINDLLSTRQHEFIKQGNSHFYFLQVASILK